MKVKHFCKKHGAAILLITGCVELGAALWAMRKAAMKEQSSRAEAENDLEPVELAKIYAPVVILTTGSLACFVGGYVLSKKRIEAMSMAYSVLSSRFNTYRKKVDEIFGEGSDKKVRESIAEDEYKNLRYIHYDDKQLFYDDMMQEWFWATKEQVKDAVYILNRSFIGGCEVSLNNWLELTGREPVAWGEDFGWSQYAMECLDGALWIDFCFKLKQTPDGEDYWFIYCPFEANNIYRSFCGDEESYTNIDRYGIVNVSEKMRR